ncbi:hypothetical protein [Mycolicibacter kumamotonensis]|nr:hypothetical protein [Mycolicibacter kumamotonensis]
MPRLHWTQWKPGAHRARTSDHGRYDIDLHGTFWVISHLPEGRVLRDVPGGGRVKVEWDDPVLFNLIEAKVSCQKHFDRLYAESHPEASERLSPRERALREVRRIRNEASTDLPLVRDLCAVVESLIPAEEVL